MGVNYTQHCIMGLELKYEDMKVVVSPAKYEEQNRYDNRTGKVTHTENVLVQREEYYFEAFGVKNEEFYEFVEELADKYELDSVIISGEYSETVVYVGKKIGDEYDCGRVDLLIGNYSLQELQEAQSEVERKLGVEARFVELYFGIDVG
jgi:hypothetical protein